MTNYKIEAWVKNSPNTAPIATCETRSFTMAMALKNAIRKEGFEAKLEEIISESAVKVGEQF